MIYVYSLCFSEKFVKEPFFNIPKVVKHLNFMVTSSSFYAAKITQKFYETVAVTKMA